MPHYPVISYGVVALETDQPGAENGSVVKEHVIQAWGVPSEGGTQNPHKKVLVSSSSSSTVVAETGGSPGLGGLPA